MKIRNYILLSSLLFMAFGCNDENLGRNGVTPAPGTDVQFGVSLGQTETRTVYGEGTNTGFPVYWVNGDEVLITAPNCAIKGADYAVEARTEAQNYADNLTKTGEAGIQWGDEETSDFYSIYPAANASASTTDYTTMTLRMPEQQDGLVASGNTSFSPNMNACFMYAKTEGAQNGTTVDLRYKPLSTALRFTLNGPTTGETVQINRIIINAPEGVAISGSFTVDMTTASATTGGTKTIPSLTPVTGYTSNSVIIVPAYSSAGYLTLNAGDKLEVCAFMLLQAETELSANWNIQVVTGTQTYTKSLTPATSSSSAQYTLVPGKVHTLPALPALNATEWEASKWMEYIPRNVYLSQISIPGSWNSLNSDFQGTSPDLTTQYSNGVRAFHLDTRWATNNARGLFTSYTLISDVENCNTLAIANGSTAYDVKTSSSSLTSQGQSVLLRNTVSFTKALETITAQVKDEEYLVLYCTFAQGNYDYNRANGGWERRISEACANNDKVIDARTITANTCVKDVLGKVIVIINSNTTEYISGSKCMFTTLGMQLDQSAYTSNNYYELPLRDGNNSSTISFRGTHAQVTAYEVETGYMSDTRGYAPSLTERQTKGNNILNWSSTNHQNIGSSNYDHSHWIYLGLGGYQVSENSDRSISGSYGTVATTLNGWIEGKVDAMGVTDGTNFYPVGIVLMNNVNDYAEVCRKILQLNNQYRKAYDPDRSAIDGSDLNSSGNLSTNSVNNNRTMSMLNGGNAF